jgi:hypothetical protein
MKVRLSKKEENIYGIQEKTYRCKPRYIKETGKGVLQNTGQKIPYSALVVKCYFSGHFPSPCFYLKKHNISEMGLCLHLQVKPTQLGPIDSANPYLWTKLLELIYLWSVYRRHLSKTQNVLACTSKIHISPE